MRTKRLAENVIHGWFLLMGLVTVGCVLLISVYLIVSGIPAIREIGLIKFLFGPVWDSNGAQPQFGILPFILTSVYGTAGAILLGVPVGFMTAVFLAKMAPPKLKAAVSAAVSQNPDAIGYASLASIKDSVKALNVDGVTPSEATVKDGSYKVQRPFVLVTVEGKALSSAAQSFFDYATSPAAADIIAKAGAVAAN